MKCYNTFTTEIYNDNTFYVQKVFKLIQKELKFSQAFIDKIL